jgi:zinc/manganese transport system permease protein
MFAQEFMRHAYLAGTPVALACGLIGWFVVLRSQVFAGDALSHVAFVGAIAAALVGVHEQVGLLAVTVALAVALAGLGPRARADDVTIGVVFSWVLGVGVLLIARLSMGGAGANGLIVANTLFGSIFGLGATQSVVVAAVAAGALLGAVVIARPLLFASIDPDLAALQGLPVRALGLVLLVLLGSVTAEGTQAIGALLVLGLVAGPAGAALALTSRPYLGMALSAALALCAMWVGLALSYVIPSLPPSTAITGLVVAMYGTARLAGALRKDGRSARARGNAGRDDALGAAARITQ